MGKRPFPTDKVDIFYSNTQILDKYDTKGNFTTWNNTYCSKYKSIELYPQLDWEAFKKTCFWATQNYGAKYIRLSGSYADNYKTAWFTHKYDPTKRILGMINIYYPLMGFLLIDSSAFENVDANGIPERIKFGGWSFKNQPVFEDTNLTYWFLQSSYRVLSREEVCEPLEFEVTSKVTTRGKRQQSVILKNRHELKSDEIEDLYRFRSRVETVADVVFGFFD